MKVLYWTGKNQGKEGASVSALLALRNWSACKRFGFIFPVLFLNEHYEVPDSSFCGHCSAEQSFAAEEQGLLEPAQTPLGTADALLTTVSMIWA